VELRKKSIKILRDENFDEQVLDTSNLELLYKQKLPNISPVYELGISPRIYVQPVENDISKVKEKKADDINLNTLEPKFFRQTPPLLFQIKDDEINWINPDLMNYEPLWDYNMCIRTTSSPLLREYLTKAFETTLTGHQIRRI
jgi:hypothetical protein